MTPRPHVLVNMAVTADGKIDTFERAGARISGEADTERVDRLRAEADAVMVGGHTLLREDPRLTVRDPALQATRQERGLRAQPAKVGVVSHVAGPTGDMAHRPGDHFLFDGGGTVVICTTRRTSQTAIGWLREQGAEVIVHGDIRVDLPASLAALSEMGIQRLLVEGGSTVVAALLEADLVDELQLAVAPLLFGGETAPTPVAGPGWSADEARRLRLVEVDTDADGDVILRYTVAGHDR